MATIKKNIEVKVNEDFIKAIEDAQKALDVLKNFDGKSIIEIK